MKNIFSIPEYKDNNLKLIRRRFPTFWYYLRNMADDNQFCFNSINLFLRKDKNKKILNEKEN